jgi:8-oxo-dGTP pyrophosphatase MutT (NUDIX family)
MSEPVPAVPAATILIVRDGASGLEVFMVKRHYQIDFMAGALVFPGGKVHAGDRDAMLSQHVDGIAVLSEDELALRAAAIREAFEESGILFAREEGSAAFISAKQLAPLDRYRAPLEKGEASFADVLRSEHLRLACDCLVPFAHWITPMNMPKRFDTHFFIAAAPEGHAGAHDGRESVDSVWINPDAAIADRKKWNLVFPTKLNLMKLAPFKTVADAIAVAQANPPLTVTPWIEEAPEGQRLRIREDAGYAQTSTLLRNAF